MDIIKTYPHIEACCVSYILAMNDTMNVLSGKWKLPILAALLYNNKRFKDIKENVGGITPRMLSKELKELEINGVIARKVYDDRPVLIEYELTESGKSITKVMDAMVAWGVEHREKIIQK